MKRALNVVSRTPILAIFVVIIVASMSFALFNVVSQPAASPSAAATATPTPTLRPAATLRFPTPWPTSLLPTRTPLPTPDLGPTSTPTPIIPTPVWTPIPPIVTNWITFTGKSGFSFSYPSGWNVSEDFITNSPVKPIIIKMSNVRGALPRSTTIIPGGMMIELINYIGAIPPGGTPFTVGSQKHPGIQLVYGREDPRVEPQFRVLERSITIHFTAGQRQWAISGSFYPPTEGVDEYTKIFYQIVGSLRYANQ